MKALEGPEVRQLETLGQLRPLQQSLLEGELKDTVRGRHGTPSLCQAEFLLQAHVGNMVLVGLSSRGET